jgi:Na+-transporting methylmalonyl-CoA/oxaloacetate decarboxylase gamma subunit
MNDWMAPNIPLTIVVFTALAAVVLRAVARRPEPEPVPSAKPALVTVTAEESQPRPAVTAITHNGAGREAARPRALPGRPAGEVGRAQHIFHELHPQGRNAVCAVCDSQYRSA